MQYLVWGRTLANTRFRSKSEHTLDEKGRLNIPARFRAVLDELRESVLMVAPWEGYLRAFPPAAWEEFETKLMTSGGHERLGRLTRYVVGHMVECKIDKQGRIHLPPDLRAEANLGKEVVLTGMVDWVEIWDKESWTRMTKDTRDNFGQYADNLANLGVV